MLADVVLLHHNVMRLTSLHYFGEVNKNYFAELYEQKIN